MPKIRGEIRNADTNKILASLKLADVQDNRIRAQIGRQKNADDSPATHAQVRDEIYRFLRGLALKDAIRSLPDRVEAANEVLESEGW